MARDWNQDFCLFYAAYPGSNPFILTLAVFLERVKCADKTHAVLQGRYTEEMGREDDVARLNRLIKLKERFGPLFPESDQ